MNEWMIYSFVCVWTGCLQVVNSGVFNLQGKLCPIFGLIIYMYMHIFYSSVLFISDVIRERQGEGEGDSSSSRGRGRRSHPPPPRFVASASVAAPSSSDNVPERELQRRDEVELQREMQ